MTDLEILEEKYGTQALENIYETIRDDWNYYQHYGYSSPEQCFFDILLDDE